MHWQLVFIAPPQPQGAPRGLPSERARRYAPGRRWPSCRLRFSQKPGKINWTRTRCTSCHSTEVCPFQIGGTVRTPELKGTGGAGPVGYASGSDSADSCPPASLCAMQRPIAFNNVKISTVVSDHNHLSYIKETHGTNMSTSLT